MADFFDETADVASGEEEEEEELNEEGQPSSRRSKNPDMNDSSEEEDDDDEEAEREVREGFIVDEEEDDEDAKQRKRERREERRKRRREEAEDDNLDEEDLDLIGEVYPDREAQQTQKSKYKRLKRGHRDDRQASEARGVEDIFSDDEEGADGAAASRSRGAFAGGFGDEMDDFIEEDEMSGEEGEKMREDLEIRQPSKGGLADLQNLRESGLDEADLEDMRGAFGDGNEFEWALDVEKDLHAAEEGPDRDLELKDVFEPSQLVEKMLTEDDNKIRANDVPERLQIARKPYKDFQELSEEQQAERLAEEPKWISNILFPGKQLHSSLREPFEQAVSKVLEFMNVEDYEPAFIFQNRKDYLIHSEQVPLPADPSDPDAPKYEIKADKLLNQGDLWELLDYDLKYRAFAEKRDGIRKSVEMLKSLIPDFSDTIFDDLMPDAVEIEDLQDLQDYLNFQYSQQLKDLSAAEAEAHGTQKRARGTRSVWDKVRAGNAYHLVRAFGITADAFAQNTSKIGRKNYTEDPDVRPDDMADTLVQEPEYRTGKEVLASARAMFVEEIATNPRIRRQLRKMFVEYMVFDAVRTDKGLKQIDAEHPYYEFKYLRNQGIRNFFSRPDLFLRMLKAEQDGLIEIKIRLQNERRILDDLTKSIESDNFSEVADAWNSLRREIVSQAFIKLHRVIAKGWKDHMRNICEGKVATECREAYLTKLDQAPYKPKGMVLGTTPRVLALSNGAGDRASAICWAYVDENGRVLENGKFTDMRLGNPERYTSDGKDVAPFVELVERRKPDVLAVSGWSVETRRLYKDLQDIVERHSLQGTPYEDPEDDREVSDPLEIFMVNDEVARLYHTSARANTDHPSVPPLTRYSIALAMYMQNPVKEYASLGRDIISITFDPSQHLIPEDKLTKALDSAMVDIVNLVGIDINDAVNDASTAKLLPFISGLGPRKADQMLKIINSWGGDVNTRAQLATGEPERNHKPAVGPKCWVNCSSFLYVVYEATENDTDYLDNTRIHPEDYDIARKIAADALEFDEEDIKTEVDQNGPAAVVRRLVADDQQDKVNDLLLEEYAEQLETKFGQKKRATLELIRAELQNPFEELRRNFDYLSSTEIFTMLTGETATSLQEHMIIPVSVKRTSSEHIEVKLDCGVDGNISSSEFPDEVTNNGLEPRQVWSIHQTIRAKITHLDRKKLHAQLTMRDNEMRNPFRRQFDHDYGTFLTSFYSTFHIY